MLNEVEKIEDETNFAHESYQLMTNDLNRILIIDDNQEMRIALSEILVNQGYHITTAKDGLDALRYLEAEEELPSLILLDLIMPVKNGREFLDEQKKNPKISNLPVIIITGDHVEDLPQTDAAKTCVFKPIDVFEVIDAVEKYKLKE